MVLFVKAKRREEAEWYNVQPDILKICEFKRLHEFDQYKVYVTSCLIFKFQHRITFLKTWFKSTIQTNLNLDSNFQENNKRKNLLLIYWHLLKNPSGASLILNLLGWLKQILFLCLPTSPKTAHQLCCLPSLACLFPPSLNPLNMCICDSGVSAMNTLNTPHCTGQSPK